jgi:integrase/recombinase XerD
MDTSNQGISPLRQRMLEDMRMRKLSPKTQAAYIRSVRQLAGYLRRAPDTATIEDLRNFQLHWVDHGTSPISLNAAITGLKFFFGITLDRGELMAKMQPVFVPRTLPVVLSREEVVRLIGAAGNLKHQTALSVAYGAGLRAAEVAALKVGDVDSARMTLRIEQGKGAKDRYAMLSPVLLTRLRTWWQVARAQGKMLKGGWLFPGLNPIEPVPGEFQFYRFWCVKCRLANARIGGHVHCNHGDLRSHRPPSDYVSSGSTARWRSCRDRRVTPSKASTADPQPIA